MSIDPNIRTSKDIGDERIRKGLPRDWADVARGPKAFDLRQGGWQDLMVRYAGMGPADPLDNIFKETIGQEHPTLAQLESGYIDEDFRDEYVHFYARTYRDLPSRCERLHFFDTVDAKHPRYLGWMILRPILGRPVSRTMLAPPRSVAEHVSCVARGSARPWGYALGVQGFPFISQDAQFGSCAHAAIWMVALYFHLRFNAPRYHLSDVAQSARRHQDVHPALPSGGLTGMQISAVLHDLNMTPMIYPSDKRLPYDAESIACRYLNSGLPVILLNETDQTGHAKVLIGYGRDEDGLFFVHHDDQRGPYRLTRELVPVPRARQASQAQDEEAANGDGQLAVGRESQGWDALVVPMPGKIFLSGEAAETWGSLIFKESFDEHEHLRDLAGQLDDGRLRLCCYVVESGEYMRRLRERGVPHDVVVWHTGIPSSHWLWIVELQDLAAARDSRECVLGELAIDATSDDQWINPLFANLPGITLYWPTLGDEIQIGESSQDRSPYASGCALHVPS